jgi:hypothetical protein
MERMAGRCELRSIKRLSSGAEDMMFILRLGGAGMDHPHTLSMASPCICSRLFNCLHRWAPVE